MKYYNIRLLLLLAAITLIASGLVLAQEQKRSLESTLNNFSVQDAKEYLGYLASKELKGREAGTPEGLEAAEYIADKFEDWGLESVSDNKNYFQTVPRIGPAKYDKDNYFRVWTAGLDADEPKADEFKLDEDYAPLGYVSKSEISSTIVFAGYGVTDTKLGYDDYADTDVKDKIVMIFRYIPLYGSEQTPFTGSHYNNAYFHSKYENAVRNKAKAILIVNPPSVPDSLIGSGRMGSARTNNIPFIHISQKLADKILEGTGNTIASLQSEIENNMQPASFSIKFRKLFIKISNTRSNGQNVLAKISGSDEKLKDEIIIIGAHYDHIGLGYFASRLGDAGKGKIHYGADDNASGTTGVMLLAKNFAKYAPKLKRTIIFALWDGEEKGLLGSSFFVNNPPVKLSNIKAYINFDMIGRMQNSNLTIIGTGTSPGWDEILKQANEEKLQLRTSRGVGGGSDHISFAAKNIPVLFCITWGHQDYHTPYDTPDKINYEGLIKVTKLACRILFKLTDSEKNPLYKTQK